MPAVGHTLTRLLAIVGAGFILATGHAFIRTAWFDQPPVVLARQAALNPAPTPPANPPTDQPTAEDQPLSALDAPVKPGSINLREAFQLFENGAYFLDARYKPEYLAGHIEGAFWMPASRVTTAEGLNELRIIEPGGIVVIYCTGGDCDASENTAIRIEAAGFDFDIRILGKGYTDWADAGLPTATGQDGGEG